MTSDPSPGWLRRYRRPIVAGVLTALGYLLSTLPLSLPFTIFVGFIPLLRWIDAEPSRPWREARTGGFVFGSVIHLLILHWMLSMLAMSFLAIFAYLGLVLVFAVEITVAVLLLTWARRRTGWSFALLLPAAWLSLEWFQAVGDLRMTAQHLGHVLAATPFLVQFADVVGPYGVGAFVLVINATLYEALRRTGRHRRAHGAALVVLVVVALGYDAWSWLAPVRQTGTLRVCLVQPDVSLADKMDPATDPLQLETLTRLTREGLGHGVDLVVWPETARPKTLWHDPLRPETYAMKDLGALAREIGTPILTGAEYATVGLDARPTAYYNAAFVVRADGTLDPTWAAKVYLVPFVEGIPFRPLLGGILGDLGGSLRWLAGGFVPGPEGRPLRVGDHEVGMTVCFEELFFDRHRSLKNAGAEFQVVLTNHAWFRRSVFQPYAANTVRLRAIENRQAFIRVANTGISGFVDPHGRYHETTGLFVEAVRTHDVPLNAAPTLYDRAGDLVAYLAMLLLAGAVTVGGLKEPSHG